MVRPIDNLEGREVNGWLIEEYVGGSRCECGVEYIKKKKNIQNGIFENMPCCYIKRDIKGVKVRKTWEGIKDRIFNEKNASYKYYGGRGLTMESEWVNSFEEFYKEIGDPPEGNKWTIDRIDNNLGYVKGNIRWANIDAQANNRRNNITTIVNGELLTAAQIAKKYNLDRAAIARRIKRGLNPLEKIKVGRFEKQINFNGIVKTPKEWANYLEITVDKIYRLTSVLKSDIEAIELLIKKYKPEEAD